MRNFRGVDSSDLGTGFELVGPLQVMIPVKSLETLRQATWLSDVIGFKQLHMIYHF
jgi:hypothetical protein